MKQALVPFLVALLTLSACGSSENGGGSTANKSTQALVAPGPAQDAGSTQPEAAASPLQVTCAQIDFGDDRYPGASQDLNLSVAKFLADRYSDTGADEAELLAAFSATLLSICNKTKDASYRPVPQAVSLAEQARASTDSGAGSDFPVALSLAAAGAQGKEANDADAQFVRDANALCRKFRKTITPLVDDLVNPDAGGFPSTKADRLNSQLDNLTSGLTDLAKASPSEKSKGFAEGYAVKARAIGKLASRLGKLSENYYDNIDKAISLESKIGDKTADLSTATGDVKACGRLFSGV